MPPYPVTVFDRPQWTLLPDPAGRRMYANVSNVLEVTRGAFARRVPLAVPTELFTLMKDVLHVPLDAEVTLALDSVDKWYVFSLLAEGKEPQLVDLWAYTIGTIPKWIADPQFRL